MAQPLPSIGENNSTADPKILAALQELQAQVVALGAFAPGDIKATGVSVAPAGWLICDGAAVSRTTYTALFNALKDAGGGLPYGVGDNATTFNVPDLRGRVPVGPDGAAGRLDALDALGNSGGEQKHTLTTPELAAHTHGPPAGMNAGLYLRTGVSPALWTGTTTTSSGWPSPTSATPIGNVTDSGSAGGGGAHNNMQPYQIVNWLIKT